MHLTSEDARAFRKATDAFFGAIDLPRIDAKNGPPARHLHSRMPKGKSGILKMLCRLRMKLRMATGFLIEVAIGPDGGLVAGFDGEFSEPSQTDAGKGGVRVAW